MLVETVNAVRESGGNPDSLRLHGQEINLTTSAIAKMNLYLHGLVDFEIRRGDTFRDQFTERGRAQIRRGDRQSALQPVQILGSQRVGERPVGTALLYERAAAKNGDHVDPALHDRPR